MDSSGNMVYYRLQNGFSTPGLSYAAATNGYANTPLAASATNGTALPPHHPATPAVATTPMLNGLAQQHPGSAAVASGLNTGPGLLARPPPPPSRPNALAAIPLGAANAAASNAFFQKMVIPHLSAAQINALFKNRMDKKRYQKPVQCETCGISLNSDHQAQQHYSGKAHLKMLRKMGKPIPEEHLGKIRAAKDTGSNSTKVSSSPFGEWQKVEPKPSEWAPVQSTTSDWEPVCKDKYTFPGQNPLHLDYNMTAGNEDQPRTYGEFKKKRLMDLQAKAYADSTYADYGEQWAMNQGDVSSTTGRNNKRPITCTVCKDTMIGETQFEAHVTGKKHAKRLKLMDKQAQMDIPEGASEMSSDFIVQISNNQYCCSVCNVTLNGPAPVTMHLAGDKHRRRANLKDMQHSRPNVSQYSQQASSSLNASDVTSWKMQANFVPETKESFPQQEKANMEEKYDGDATNDSSEETSWLAGEVPGNRNGWMYCRICDISVQTTTKLQLHTTSSFHKNKIQDD